ncbi:MAG: iron-containing alcohol dehydrogenase [Hydrogenovibrio sp.]|uniref:iron-containing alcohol dehydrogenase n=1 Tax=Hydrogenovibrio sp. TaxID=2065821 RepID=UPI0028703182|nr:iron-containing alcohol dehydrogenase [Hydrogenovibrio sp.]MDR9498394.1 iron-containing alcohol dehydrogenase [Hydrogenovibrio sp.]
MIPHFQIAQLPALHFDQGVREQLVSLPQQQNWQRILILSSRFLTRPGEFGHTLSQQWQQQGLAVTLCAVSGEPSPDSVDALVAEQRSTQPDAVIGLGGGSVLDTAKAVAGLLPSGRSVMDFLEGVGKGHPFHETTTPFVAVPTTAGTGSETTKNAVLSRLGEFKKSFRSERLLAHSVWLDPDLLRTCPETVLYPTAMDAFTQLLESYTTAKANPVTDALAWQGLTLCREALEKLDQPETREDALGPLLLAASLSGITLANAGLGAVHGLAGPVGAFFEAPHGAVCARLLAPIIQANIDALETQTDTPQAPNLLHKYAQVGALLCAETQDDSEAAQRQALIQTLENLTRRYVPQGLGQYGLTQDNLSPVLENCRSGSMTGNPVSLADDTLYQALLSAL